MHHPADTKGRPLETALLIGAVLLNVLVVLSVRHFPYQDVTNHLTRYVLLDRSWGGSTPEWLQVSFQPTTYIAGDILGAGLVHLVGPGLTLRIMAVVPLLLLPWGMYSLLRQTNPGQRGWALVGAIFSFSWFYLSGFIEFTLGLALVCLWLAAWWPRRATRAWAPRLALALACVAMFYVHLAAPLIVLGVVGLDWLLEVTRTKSWRDPGLPQLVTLSVLAATVALTWAVSAMLASTQEATIAPPSFRSIPDKVFALAAPFLSLTYLQLGVMLAAYGIAVVALVRRKRGTEFLNAFALSGPAFLLLYFLTPRHVMGAGEVDVRWLAPALLLPFCMPGGARNLDSRLLVGLFGLSALHAAVLWHYARRIDANLSDYDRVIAAMPSAARVLPLVSDRMRYRRISPYEYYGLWYTIDKGGQVPGLFSGTGMRRGGRPMPYYEHMRVLHQLYQPPEGWGSRVLGPLDCEAIREDYAFVVQAGDDPDAGRLIRRCGTAVLTLGEITLYRVGPTP
jgi:hypothetical protein